MSEVCRKCRSSLEPEKKIYENHIKFESDLKSILLRLDAMQEMMYKIVSSLPNLVNNTSDDNNIINKQEEDDSNTVQNELPVVRSSLPDRKNNPKLAKLSTEKPPSPNKSVQKKYKISEDMTSLPSVDYILPNVILEQPIQTETIGSWSSSCENSQDSIENDYDTILHQSFLESTIKHLTEEDDLELLKSIDNVYHMENLHQTFPILHQEELDSMEDRVKKNFDYKDQLLKEMKLVRISMGVNCDFADILEKLLDRELLHYYNWYGNQGKKNLQRYKIFSQLLKEIIIPPFGKSFDDIMHRAITVSHRRKNNQVYRKKRRADAYYGKSN